MFDDKVGREHAGSDLAAIVAVADEREPSVFRIV